MFVADKDTGIPMAKSHVRCSFTVDLVFEENLADMKYPSTANRTKSLENLVIHFYFVFVFINIKVFT